MKDKVVSDYELMLENLAKFSILKQEHDSYDAVYAEHELQYENMHNLINEKLDEYKKVYEGKYIFDYIYGLYNVAMNRPDEVERLLAFFGDDFRETFNGTVRPMFEESKQKIRNMISI